MNDTERAGIRRRFLAVDTADQGLDAGFQPYPASAGKLAGWAYTIRGAMIPSTATGDPAKMEACNAISPGEVSVWSGGGEGICYFGELIALGMQERGCAGALVDGGVRDVLWLGRHGFTVFARYRTPVQSIGRWQVTGRQERVYLRGATARRVCVDPGDFILGDEDGVIVVPRDIVTAVLARAEELTSTEQRIRADLAAGLTLRQALDKYGHV